MIGDRIEINVGGGLDVALPKMVRIRQKFATPRIDDVPAAVRREFARPEIRAQVKPGMKIAVGCGSRGIANIGACVRQTIAELKALGAEPFIFPAMGSHGGATAEGQRDVLATYGITEETVGCPVHAQMDVTCLGELDGMPVYMDKLAAAADGLVFVCRIKPHTSFRAPIESGIVKMLTIGAGKITGATQLHTHGFDRFGVVLPKVAQFIMERRNLLFGMAMVENAADQTSHIEAVPAATLLSRETELQAMAMKNMPSIMFPEIDVLVIEEIGKDVSGSGMDPNITGRNFRHIEWEEKPFVRKVVLLGFTPETHGNACGFGIADVITMRMFRELDLSVTYSNVITSTCLDAAAIPMIMNNDHDAIAVAVKTTTRVLPIDTKIVRIRNTLSLIEIEVSEPLLPQVLAHPELFDVLGPPQPLPFDAEGNLPPFAPAHGH